MNKLEPGIYHIKQTHQGYIVEVPSNKYLLPGKFISTDFGHSYRDEIRKATPEEQEWFRACQQAGKYVSPPKIEYYEIY